MKIEELITFLANTDEPFAKVQAELTYGQDILKHLKGCLLYTSPSPRDRTRSRMPSSA